MALEIREVRTRSELREFIYLPEGVHRDSPRWIPPIYPDEWRYFNPKKNRSFSYSDTVLFLARRDGRAVGRIMGIINHRVIEKTGKKDGRFGFIETHDDREACLALLKATENWARNLGMTRIVGPMGFTDQDPEGLLIEGFDQEPSIAIFQNREYLARFIEGAGYTKEVDYFDYLVPVPDQIPPLYAKILARAERRGTYQLREFTRTRDLKPFIRPVLALMNETFSDLYGYSPLDEAEMDGLARQYLPLLDPRFVKVVTKGPDVVSFVVAIPNFNSGLRRSRGQLWPFGVFLILRAIKKSHQLDLLLGGIRQDCRGQGLDALMGAGMMRSAIAAGLKHMDSHHELESNVQVRSEMERAGGRIFKRFRIFQKAL
jgi:hypothetical protein